MPQLPVRTINDSEQDHVADHNELHRLHNLIESFSGEVSPPEHYRHVQSQAASTWTIAHNLGFMPGGVFVRDSGGTMMSGRVTHTDNNNLTIQFFVAGVPAAFTGEAFLS